MKHTLHTLKNGLRVICIPQKGVKTATVIVMTGTGSRYETARENGLAHFLEHMFFKGTSKRKSARAITEELDGVGSIYNAFTTKDRTAYYAKVSDQYLDTAIDVVSDIFLNSTLPTKEITKERGAIIQEIDMYEDMPMRGIHEIFDALIFGADHSLGRSILGPKENIRTFSRNDFARYRRSHYTPANTVVCVAGAFSEKEILAKITREYGKLTPAPSPTYVPFTGSQSAAQISIKHKKTDQTQLILGVPAYPYLHRDEFALEVLTTILGGGMSSRLFLEVREKRGLAYSVHAWTDAYPDTGYLAVQAGVEHGKVELALSTMLAEFKKICRSPVTLEELAKAKAHLKGTTALRLETSDAVAEHAASSLVTLGRVRELDEIVQSIDRVSVSDIQRVAKDILRTNTLNLAIIGPHANPQKLLSILHV